MARSSTITFATAIAALFVYLSLVPSFASATDIAYCSTQNTGADGQSWAWDWQSNGWCSDKCRGAYAFAIISYKDCWCSNFIPEAQDSSSKCDGTCPGYPTEICGSNSGDKFVYLAMGNKPSGTAKGALKPTSTNTPPHTTLTTTTLGPPPITSNRVITVSGQIVTETVVIPNPSKAPSLGDNTNQSKGANVGAIAGGVVGGIVGLLAIVGGVLFFMWRRRRQQKESEDGQTGVHRNVSTMSKSGLLRTEKPAQFPPPIATSFNKRNSRNMMQDTDSVSPVSGSDRRNSRPYLFDQRLNPSAIMAFDNTSQGSIASMDDSRDYGRTLNVRNPDPEPRG